MNLSLSFPRTRGLSIAIGAILSTWSLSTPARIIEGSDTEATVAKGDAPEAWTVLDGAGLYVQDGGRTLAIDAKFFSRVFITGRPDERSAVTNIALYNGASTSVTHTDVINTESGGSALFLGEILDDDSVRGIVKALAHNSVFRGDAAGAHVTGAGELTAHRTEIEGTGAGSQGILLVDGKVMLHDGSRVTGSGNGVRIEKDVEADDKVRGRRLVVDASHVEGLGGAAIAVSSKPGQGGSSTVELSNGATLVGKDNMAIAVDGGSTANVAISDSQITGHIVTAMDSVTHVDLVTNATLTGYMSHAADVRIGARSRWTATDRSDVTSLALDGGTLAFEPNGVPADVTVHGNLLGSGGALHLNTVLNRGGDLAGQYTDRLLIEGDVATAGTTTIHVASPSQAFAGSTDRNGNGAADANEGISLVQVAGVSRADAFALAGGYVAAGPWQYTLHAFGPGTTDASQNALAQGSLNWDYRLASRVVCEDDCEGEDDGDDGDGDGEDPGDGSPGDDNGPGDEGGPGHGGEEGVPGGRPAVVPQIPSYLVAPLALLAYGDTMIDGLHQRLGDLREESGSEGTGGEVFARYVGGDYRYTSSRTFRQFGYDFAQRNHALQVGGSVLATAGEASTLRAGWALDHGTTRVTPKAVDGASRATYTANGASAWITWQGDDGMYLDGVVGGRRYVGDVGTSLRGSHVARVRASAAYLSMEVGYPFALSPGWTLEPQLQVKHQSLRFRDFRDADGLDVRLGAVRQTTTRLGAAVTRTADARWMPYGRLDVIHTSGGTASVDVSSEPIGVSAGFGTARTGHAVKASVGAVSQLSPHVQLYGEGGYQRHLGSFGFRGYAANVGLRVTF